MAMSRDNAIKIWKERVYNHSEIDPDDRHDWESLAFGFFLALEFSVEEIEEIIEYLIDNTLL